MSEMAQVADDTTKENRAVLWQALFNVSQHQDDNGYIWLHFTDLYTSDDLFNLHTLLDIGLLEGVYSVESIDKNAEDWRSYFKRNAHRLTSIGQKVLDYRSVYIHEGGNAVLEAATSEEMSKIAKLVKKKLAESEDSDG